MPSRTIYIRESDAALWDWLCEEAFRQNRSMSSMLALAITALKASRADA